MKRACSMVELVVVLATIGLLGAGPVPKVTIELPRIAIGDSLTKGKVEKQIPLGEPFGIEATIDDPEKHDGPILHVILEFVRVEPAGREIIENTAIAFPSKADDGSLVIKSDLTPIRNVGDLTLRVRTNKKDVAAFSLSTTK